MNITKLFNKPKIIGILSDPHQGKSNLIYHALEEIHKEYDVNVFYYGLKCNVKGTRIHSVEELEGVRNSLVVLDEFFTLFDLDNRKIKQQIENDLRLIFHNNNILLLAGMGENFKKFISAKVNVFMYKKITFADMINGSRAKRILMDFEGDEKGSKTLSLNPSEVLIFDGKHYHKQEVPYLRKYDSKADNKPILTPKSGSKECAESVPENVQEKCDYLPLENLMKKVEVAP